MAAALFAQEVDLKFRFIGERGGQCAERVLSERNDPCACGLEHATGAHPKVSYATHPGASPVCWARARNHPVRWDGPIVQSWALPVRTG
jgi:hypothetical protein